MYVVTNVCITYFKDMGFSEGWNPQQPSSPPTASKKSNVQVLCRNDFDKKILLLLDALWERNKLQEAPLGRLRSGSPYIPIWRCPRHGGTPVIIHFCLGFSLNKPSSYWGTPMIMETHLTWKMCPNLTFSIVEMV